MLRLLQTSFVAVLVISTVSAQPYYQKVTYEPSCTNIYSYSQHFNSDGSLVTCGRLMDLSHGVSNGGSYSYVDADGQTVWMKATDSLGSHGSVQLPNGDLVLLGYSRYLGTPGAQPSDGNFVLTRMTAAGSLVWCKAFGDQYDDFATYMHLLPNGNLELYGLSEEYAGGTYDNFRARVSPSGALLEMKFQAASNVNYGDYFDYDPATGNTYVLSWSAATFYVKCIDSTYNISWENHYTSNVSAISSIRVAPNGTLLVTGNMGVNTSAVRKGFIMSLSSTGAVLWSKRYDWGGLCSINSAEMLPNGNIVATGRSDAYTTFTQFGDYQNRMVTMITDISGTPLAATVYGNDVRSDGRDVFALNDSVIYFAGEHGLKVENDGFFYLRLDPTLTNPAFCYRPANVSATTITYNVSPYTSTYTIGFDTVAVVNDNPVFQSIPVANILICPTRTFIYSNEDFTGYAVTATSDSGFVFVGQDGLNGGLMLTKYDLHGHTLWSRRYGFSSPYNPDHGFCIREAHNGDLLIGHGSSSYSSGGHACVFRTDADGNPIWCTDKSVGGNEQSYIREIAETPDHRLVGIAGLQQGNFPTSARFALIKYDSLGNSLWSKEFINVQSFEGGLAADSGGFTLSGNTVSTALALRTDTAGTVLWSRELTCSGNNADMRLSFAERCPNGDLIYAGSINSGGSGPYTRPYIIRFDSAGTMLWHKMYQPGAEQLSGITGFTPLAGDRYLVTVLGPGGSTANYKTFNFIIDAAGNVTWTSYTPPTANGGMEFYEGAVGVDSCIAFPSNEVVSFNRYFHFQKFSPGLLGPCTATSASVTASVPATVTVTDPALTSFPVTLTETSLTAVVYVDSTMREYVCVTGDTGFYNPLALEEISFGHATNDSTQSFVAYPVPGSGVLNIRGFSANESTCFTIHSMTGAVLAQRCTSADAQGVQSVDISMLPDGVYCISFVPGTEGGSGNLLFIVQTD